MRVSISQVKDHLLCPQLAHNRHVLRRGLDKRSDALDFGTLWHREMAFRLMPKWEAPLIYVPSETLMAYEEWRGECPEWERPEGWEVEGVEVGMSMPLGQHEIVGTLDAIVKWNGKWWHLQHKSLAESVPLSVFCETQRMDFHEIVYQRMAEMQGYMPFRGTILNVLRKLSRKRLRAGENPYHIEEMTREAELVEETLRDLNRVIEAMQFETPIKNRSACGGLYRNSLCQYHSVCGREITLDDERYVDLEERYPT
jgi:hypothetical protein